MVESRRVGSGYDVSVVVCTRNRATRLAELLQSACSLVVPNGLRWELVILNNGSTDGTSAVASRFAAELPLREILEPLPGLSNARNRAVAEVRGAYLCWTDDDVLLDPKWLSAYVEAFDRHPEAAIFGGKILPLLEQPVPAWFASGFSDWPVQMMAAERDFGEEPMPVAKEGHRLPWGANYAIRTREQRRHLYDPRLGLAPKQRRGGEEIDVICRILRDGGTGWWVPGSIVRHVIRRERQSRRYLIDYHRGQGETAAFLSIEGGESAPPEPPSFIKESTPRLTLRALYCLFRAAAAAAMGRHKASLRFVAEYGFHSGVLGFRRLVRRPSAS